MKKFSKGHKQVSCYADGGKVKRPSKADWAQYEKDYGPRPSFVGAVKERLGIGAKKAGQAVADAAVTGVKKAPMTGEVLTKLKQREKKILDET